MRVTLSEHEIVLCIAALEHASKDLTEGVEAAIRLGLALDSQQPMMTSAKQMTELRKRLLESDVECDTANA